MAAHLVRHTVSASTAPTQASSTMQALETLGVVKRSGSGKNPVFEVVDGPLTRKIEELLATV
jgi:ABC-type microcin C transport system duplicated ATPase subunit YejF